jgi:hypothetical protein
MAMKPRLARQRDPQSVLSPIGHIPVRETPAVVARITGAAPVAEENVYEQRAKAGEFMFRVI